MKSAKTEYRPQDKIQQSPSLWWGLLFYTPIFKIFYNFCLCGSHHIAYAFAMGSVYQQRCFRFVVMHRFVVQFTSAGIWICYQSLDFVMLSGLGLGKIFIGSIKIHAIFLRWFCDLSQIYRHFHDFLRYPDIFCVVSEVSLHICVISEVSRHKSTDVDAEFDEEQR